MPCLSSLIKKGLLVQGCLLDCSEKHLSADARAEIQDGRAVASYRKKQPISDQHRLLILSQDCDINNPTDPFIEILPIKKLPSKKIDERIQKNRNYRKLQLPVNDEFWLLETELVSIVAKQGIENEDLKVIKILDPRSKQIMIDWRVGRYNRNPFPDKFNRDFLMNYLRKSEYGLGEYLKTNHNDIIDLFVYVTPRDEEQAEEYRVSITALIDQECSLERQEEIEETLRPHWQRLHKMQNSLKMTQIDTSCDLGIEVTQELALKPSDFTLLDAAILSRITLDYLCYD